MVNLRSSKSQFEDLPNEILIDIFKHLDARHLFQAFASLNSRLNHLIQSFQYLKLFFHIHQLNILKTNNEYFSYYVHTLVVNSWINFNLQHFPSVRYLKLDCPLPQVLGQLKPHTMPYLKHLSISFVHTMLEMNVLFDRIFSNCFQHLKSCELLSRNNLITISTSSSSPMINKLKLANIDILTYQRILFACSNLHFFQFNLHINTYYTPTSTLSLPLHDHLKQLSISLDKSHSFYDDNQFLYQLLSCLPNLQEFQLFRTCSLDNLINYDWFASIIRRHLLKLRLFKYSIRYSSIDNEIELRQIIQHDFSHLHQGHYTAHLILDRESL